MFKIQTSHGRVNRSATTKNVEGVTFAVVCSLVYGFMPIFAKVLYNNRNNTMMVLSVRYLIASIVLLLYFFFAKVDLRIGKQNFTILF